jgi:hypothetical protein
MNNGRKKNKRMKEGRKEGRTRKRKKKSIIKISNIKEAILTTRSFVFNL